MQDLICLALQLYRLAIFAWIILSWIQISSGHPLARITIFLDRIMYPLILPLRRVIPPLRLGGMMLDLTPIVLLVGVSLLMGVVC